MRVNKDTEILRKGNIITSSNSFQDTSRQEHCPVLAFGSNTIHGKEGAYLTHVTPKGGDAKALADEIFKTMESFKICDSVVGILGDGCAKNTGAHRGVIRQLEEKLCGPLAHFICLYHCNELPFRHIFDHLDGSTSGPKTFNGDIGWQIGEDLTELQVVEFKRIHGKVEKPPYSVISKLSKDQKYLLAMALACQTGQSAFLTKKGLALAKRSPGCLNHSRWLTWANRILRLYVSTSKPSSTLSRLVYIILDCYASNWFNLKKNHGHLEGPKSFFQIVSSYNDVLTLEEQAIVEPVLTGNNYFENPENWLFKESEEKGSFWNFWSTK